MPVRTAQRGISYGDRNMDLSAVFGLFQQAFDWGTGQPWLLISAGGFAVGLLVGMTGVGAGALTTPMLISGFGVAPAVAVGTDLLFAAITKASAAARHHRLGNVSWPILAYLAAGSLTSALATIAAMAWLTPDAAAMAGSIRMVLAVALVLSAIAVPLVPFLMSRSRRDVVHDPRPRPFATVVFGLVLGALVVITSVGAGAVGVAVLTLLYPAIAARRIVGTDIVHAIPLAALSGLGHMSLGHVDFVLLGTLLVGSIPGILIGSRLIGMLPDWVLRLTLSAVLIVAAYVLALKD